MAENEIPIGLLRQRKGLILSSLLLLFICYVKVKIKEVDILGAKIEIKKPEGIIHFIWIVWVYFLIRYYQYFIALKEIGIEEDFRKRLEDGKTNKLYKKLKKRSQNDNFILGQHDEIKLIPHSLFYRKLVVYTPKRGEMTPIIEEKVWFTSVIWLFFKACWQTSIYTTYVTDYFIPFIVAGITFCFVIFQICVSYWFNF